MRNLGPALGAAVVLATLLLAATVLRRAAAPPVPASVVSSQGGNVVPGPSADAVRAPARRAAALRAIAASATYLGFMLAEQDSMLRRWPERVAQPLRIYLPPGDDLPGWHAGFDAAVQAAFYRWERVGGVPIRFLFVRDSAGAEVRVRWIPEFAGRRSGQADIVWNGNGWIVRGTLTLALRSPGGPPLPEDAIHTVALHEIGHLLGLGHSDDSGDVMHATTDIRDLTMRDRASADLLYALEPGSLKASPR